MKKIFKKTKFILQDTSGSATLIFSTVCLFFLLLITIFVIGSIEYRTLVLEIQSSVENSLENYINSETIDEINSIKNGTNYLYEFDENEFTFEIKEKLYLDSNYTGMTANGREFSVSNIMYSYDNNLEISVIFTLTMPFYFTQDLYITFQNDINVSSYYETFY